MDCFPLSSQPGSEDLPQATRVSHLTSAPEPKQPTGEEVRASERLPPHIRTLPWIAYHSPQREHCVGMRPARAGHRLICWSPRTAAGTQVPQAPRLFWKLADSTKLRAQYLQDQSHTAAPAGPWQNGYVESFNGKLPDELLDGEGGESSPLSRVPAGRGIDDGRCVGLYSSPRNREPQEEETWRLPARRSRGDGGCRL